MQFRKSLFKSAFRPAVTLANPRPPSFGEVKAAEVVKSCTAVGLEKEPFAIFKFRYRPLGTFPPSCKLKLQLKSLRVSQNS